jgi:CheY-like chemotaxis protein
MRKVDPKSRKLPSLAAPQQVLLYVEDDEDNWEVAKLRLQSKYELIRARTSEEACNLMREHGETVDVILMDIELRGSELNGVELTEVLRGEPTGSRVLPSYARNLRPTSRPIVFVTAHSAKHTRVRLMLAGAEHVIAKPVDFAELQDALSDLTHARTKPGG